MINTINLAIQENSGLLHIYTFGMFVAKGKREELIELTNGLLEDERDEYSIILIKQIIKCLALGINELKVNHQCIK